MELIKHLPIRYNKNGKRVSYAEFWCTFCNRLVERRLQQGKRDKSCGCKRYELSSISLKGKKKSEEHIRKNIESHQGTNKGQDNPFYGKKHSEETRQLMRENHPDFSLENHWNWRDGKSFEEYGLEFTKELKVYIKNRDTYTCQNPNCEHKSIQLSVHHIDYDKRDSNPKNLITLCTSCHVQTNNKNKRTYWTNYYQNIMLSRFVECLL